MTAIAARKPHAAALLEGFEGAAWTPIDRRRPMLGFPVAEERSARLLDEALCKLSEAEELIAQQQERIAYLESLTMTDELTGLLNRRGFYSHFRRELAGVRRNGSGGGVLVMIDLDGFKAINDTHGHLAGDSYLRQVARLLAGQVREQDVVARLGGDEFAVLLTNTDADTGANRARQLAEAANAQQASWNGQELPIRFSIGIQPFGPGDQEDEVIRQADVSMYANKGDRRRSRRSA